MIKNDNIIRIGCFLHVMGRKKHGHAVFAAQCVYDLPEQLSCLRIKSRRRLVKDEHRRVVQQRSGYVDSPSLSARQLTDRPVFKVGKPEKL